MVMGDLFRVDTNGIESPIIHVSVVTEQRILVLFYGFICGSWPQRPEIVWVFVREAPDLA